MNKIAKFIKDLEGFTGSAKLWKVIPPLEKNDYVITSATYAMFSGPETYIFGAYKNGKVKDWTELTGSYEGDEDHQQAIKNAGYSAE